MSRCTARATTLRKSAVAALLIAATLAGCDVPNFAGPQLQTPPRGFLLQPDSRADRSMFAHLPEVHHDAWVQSLPPYSTIRINGYAGTLTLEDVLAAQDSARAHAPDPAITFGGVEPLLVDGREAWGWEERIDTPTRGIPWVAYRLMVPYDDVSYTLEFSTEDPLYKAGAPETLTAVLSTFAVGEVTYNWPLIAIGVGLLLFALHILRQKTRAKAARLQSINLVKIKKKETDAEASAEGEGGLASRPHTGGTDAGGPRTTATAGVGPDAGGRGPTSAE